MLKLPHAGGEMIEQHYIENHQRLIKRFTFRAGTEWDAQDIVQEAYSRAIKYLSSYNGDNFDKWLNTILINTFKEHKRNETGMSHSQLDEDLVEGSECTFYSDQTMEEVFELINTKAVIQIEILNLHLKQGYSAIDIKKITPYTYSNIHQIIRRFRQELRELYG
jgi:RNA polymerase sigma-70 factor (ECF subfamily)